MLKEKLLYPKAVLELLRATRLFGPQIDEAIDDLDQLLRLIDPEEETPTSDRPMV